MALVVPAEGLKRVLDMWNAGTGQAGVTLRLYQNNYTPISTSVLADFTIATFSGYADETPSFGSATPISGVMTITDSSQRNFTHNTGGTSNTVYGYYVVDTLAGKVLWAERFSASILMQNDGDLVGITLALTAASVF